MTSFLPSYNSIQEMEHSYLPPPFSLIHFFLERVIKKKTATKHQQNWETSKQENNWYDSVIRSAVIDSLEVRLTSDDLLVTVICHLGPNDILIADNDTQNLYKL